MTKKLPHTPESVCAEYALAWQDARRAVLRALRVGQMLIEVRDYLMVEHGGNLRGQNQLTPQDKHFGKWITQACGEKSERTCYRWIEAARRVALVLELPAKLPNERPLSDLYLDDSTALDDESKAIRARLDEFLQDRTIGECTRLAIDGDVPTKQIALVANGKIHGGTRGENRADYPYFVAKGLISAAHHFDHQFSLTQKAEVIAAYESAVSLMPDWLIPEIARIAAAEDKRTDKQRAARRCEARANLEGIVNSRASKDQSDDSAPAQEAAA